MYLFAEAEFWINAILIVIGLGFQVWALVDCSSRTAQAFPATGKLTKPVWLSITAAGFAISALLAATLGIGSALNPISLIAIVAALVYLADVRPAVRNVTGGGSQRW